MLRKGGIMEKRKHYGPLGIIALPGCEKLAKQVNAYLVAWRANRESDQAGYVEDSYMIDVDLPRFGNGEAKAALKQTVRGYDLYIMVDVCNYSVDYVMNGIKNPMSPDEHYQNVKRVIAACTGKPARINVVMPFLYESRQHRRTNRESLDSAMMLQELVKYLSSKEVQNESFLNCLNVPAYVGASDYIASAYASGKVTESQFALASSQVSMAEWGIPQPFITGTLNTYYYSKNAPAVFRAIIDQSSYPTTGDQILTETTSLDGIRKGLYLIEYLWMHGTTPKEFPATLPAGA